MAGQHSNAFDGCSGLSGILQGLEGRDAPTQKPMAIKRRKLTRAGAKKKPAAAPPVVVIDDDAPEPKAAPAEPRVLIATRKCATSRAYCAAKAKAKAAGLSAAEVSKAAQAAYKKEGEKWDQEHV